MRRALGVGATIVALCALAFLPGGASGGAPPREPAGAAGFDLWTGVWKADDEGGAELVLRQRADGVVIGIFWRANAPPPDPETLDPEFPDLAVEPFPGRGFGSEYVAPGLMPTSAGDVEIELRLNTEEYPWRMSLVAKGVAGFQFVYHHDHGGDNSATLELDRSWKPYRNGKAVKDAVRRGDRVQIEFGVKNLGPRDIAAGEVGIESIVSLLVVLPRTVGNARAAAAGLDTVCSNTRKTKSSLYFRCSFGQLGDFRDAVFVSFGVPAGYRAKFVRIAYTLFFEGPPHATGLESIKLLDPDGIIKIRVLPKKKGGGGGGSGGGGSGGGMAETRTFTDPTGTVTVPVIALTGSGRILFPQAIISAQAAADEYCKRVDGNGHYTMTGTSVYTKATAFEAEPGGDQTAVGLLLWEIVEDPVEVFASITCSS